MANSTATGHSKNVDNLDTLNSSINGYGSMFNPAKASLKYQALLSLALNGRNAIAAEHTAEAAVRNAGDARITAFKPLSPHITRVINALRASDASVQTVEAVRALGRKVQGVRSASKKTDEATAAKTDDGPKTRRASMTHMGFESRLDNFDMFIKQLASIPQYNPNEADLKVTGLIAMYNDLKSKNSAAMNAATQLSNARILRDDILYRNANCLVDVANDTKAYVKSVFGATSPQYKQIAKLNFRRAKKY